MTDASGYIQTGEAVSKYNYVANINERITEYYQTTKTDWLGAARPSPNFPLSLLGDSSFTSINIGDIPTTNPDLHVDHDDFNTVVNTFCEQFTLVRKLVFEEYRTKSGYSSGNGPKLRASYTGYARFVEGASDPGGAYTWDNNGTSDPVTSETPSTAPASYDIVEGGKIKSGTPYTANGFNDFTTALIAEMESGVNDETITMTYTYCHDQCHSSCYAECHHSW